VCAGRTLSRHIPETGLPTPPEQSTELCEKHLPRRHSIPRFFRIREESRGDVGGQELRSAYNRIHGFYDEFWVSEAGRPVEELAAQLRFEGVRRVIEAGCGTGFATVLLAGRLDKGAELVAVDLSEGMLEEARKRAHAAGFHAIRFIAGDALEKLGSEGTFDLVFTSWVLGYIPLKPFFAAAYRALGPGGRLAFVVHRENSPSRELGIFGELVAQDPSVLTKRVAFDFPRDMNHARDEVKAPGFEIESLREGKITFRYDSPEAVLEHLLKSGAGTAFYDAVDPAMRDKLEKRFLGVLAERNEHSARYDVVHDYVSCIARKP
ncbi:methyltransferase domain-containing protein, partial [bacterium]|nr:methyltransferase domain-containing protein [bacterium]